ncbi:COG1361 S-layer family protein [Nanoarchaeota archaeon]
MKKIILFVIFCLMMGTVSGTTSFPSTSHNVDISLVNQEPDPVQPGEILEVRFKLENFGGDRADNVQVEILPEYPFSLLPGDSSVINIGSLQARQKDENGAIVKFRLKVDENAVEGESDLEVRYKMGSGGWITPDEYSISIRTFDAIISVESVESVPKNFAPGGTGTLRLEIKNLADSVLKNVKTKLNIRQTDITTTAITTTEYPFSPIGSSNEKTLEMLNPGETEIIEFKLIADPDAEANIYKVPILITYADELANNYTSDIIVGLIIGETPDLVVNLEESAVKMRGMSGMVSIKLINKGTNDIKFCYVTLEESDDFEILSPSEVYVGSVDSDDYETVDFNIFVDSEESVVPLPLEITYKDANNKDYNTKVDVDLRLFSAEEAKKLGLQGSSLLIGIIIVIIIVVVGIFVYRRFFRKKKK